MQTQTDLAERVRQACIEAALQAYEDAGISGLCAEGRWELAIQAMRCLDLGALGDAGTTDEGPTE
jgi:hypothetical protein